MDNLEPDLCAVGSLVSRHDIAPRTALLAAPWGDERRRKAPAFLFSEAVRTFHRITIGSLVFDFSLVSSLV